MAHITYRVIEHDGGWAYEARGTFSEPYPTHDAALEAARRAAVEQQRPDETTGISWEDDKGLWHDEVASGDDRPETEVEE